MQTDFGDIHTRGHTIDSGVLDALIFLYVVSCYTLVNNSELSKISLGIALLLASVLVYKYVAWGEIRLPRYFWSRFPG